MKIFDPSVVVLRLVSQVMEIESSEAGKDLMFGLYCGAWWPVRVVGGNLVELLGVIVEVEQVRSQGDIPAGSLVV